MLRFNRGFSFKCESLSAMRNGATIISRERDKLVLFSASGTIQTTTVDADILFTFVCALYNWKRLYVLWKIMDILSCVGVLGRVLDVFKKRVFLFVFLSTKHFLNRGQLYNEVDPYWKDYKKHLSHLCRLQMYPLLVSGWHIWLNYWIAFIYFLSLIRIYLRQCKNTVWHWSQLGT